MKEIKSRIVARGAARIMLASLISGCNLQQLIHPNPVQNLVDSMAGKPIQIAYQKFGHPTGGDNPISTVHIWLNPRMSMPQLTATQSYAGSEIVGMTPEGNGVTATPVYGPQYQTNYTWQQSITYFCGITIYTDHHGVITHGDVAGCKDTKNGL